MPTRPCARPGCPTPTKTTHCPTHTGPPRPYLDPQYQAARAQLIGEPCVACGTPSTEADHIKPLSAGGTNTLENLQPMCRPCNRSKHNT